MTREIGVVIVIAEMRMVFHVIAAKPHSGRERVWQIGEDRGPFVQDIGFEDAIMSRVVDNDEHCVIGEGADAKGGGQGRPPIGGSEITEQRGDRGLSDDDGESDSRRPPVVADKTGGFRMRR